VHKLSNTGIFASAGPLETQRDSLAPSRSTVSRGVRRRFADTHISSAAVARVAEHD
jgi:hypothetical protein